MQVDVNFVYTFMSQNIKSNAVLFIFFLGGGGGGSGNANEIQKQSITYVEPEMILMQKLLTHFN